MPNTFTTDNMAVNNSIALAAKYLPIVDEVYKTTSRSAILDTPADLQKWISASTVQLYEVSVDGAGDYDRNKGYPVGNETSGWKDYTITQDRGRGHMIDYLDDEEALGMPVTTTFATIEREKVAPELDAYRFAKIASTTGVTTGTPADLTSSSDLPGLISEGEYNLDEDEVPYENRILFISESGFRYLRDQVTRTVANDDTGISHEILTYDGMRVVRVPQNRFNTAITLYDGVTSGQEAGGYVVTAGGYPINFMIVHPSAIMQVVKRYNFRMFAPGVTQVADGYLLQYRFAHDVFVKHKKVKGVYVHRGSTANP